MIGGSVQIFDKFLVNKIKEIYANFQSKYDISGLKFGQEIILKN